MGSDEAMTSERLAEIREQIDEYARRVYKKSDVMFGYGLHELLADNERLRAREAALVAVVRAVADEATVAMYPAINGGNGSHEPWCAACLCIQSDDESIHDDTCIVSQARALLASAGERAQGEA